MYLFSESASETGLTDAPPAASAPCEHWAEGAYALFVAHQFKTWTSTAVTWCVAPDSGLAPTDRLD